MSLMVQLLDAGAVGGAGACRGEAPLPRALADSVWSVRSRCYDCKSFRHDGKRAQLP